MMPKMLLTVTKMDGVGPKKTKKKMKKRRENKTGSQEHKKRKMGFIFSYDFFSNLSIHILSLDMNLNLSGGER